MHNLIAMRKTAGLSQRQLAVLMGSPRTFISKYENGRSMPTLCSVEKICGAMNVPTVDAFREH